MPAHPPTILTVNILAVRPVIIIISIERKKKKRVTARPPTNTYQTRDEDAARASHIMKLVWLAVLGVERERKLYG
jgi:hypothetical protein